MTNNLTVSGVVKIFKQQSMIIYCATAMSLDKLKVGSCMHEFKVNRCGFGTIVKNKLIKEYLWRINK